MLTGILDKITFFILIETPIAVKQSIVIRFRIIAMQRAYVAFLRRK